MYYCSDIRVITNIVCYSGCQTRFVLFLLNLLGIFDHSSSSTDFDVVPVENNSKCKWADVNNDITSRIYLEMFYYDVCGFRECDVISSKKQTVLLPKYIQFNTPSMFTLF